MRVEDRKQRKTTKNKKQTKAVYLLRVSSQATPEPSTGPETDETRWKTNMVIFPEALRLVLAGDVTVTHTYTHTHTHTHTHTVSSCMRQLSAHGQGFPKARG